MLQAVESTERFTQRSRFLMRRHDCMGEGARVLAVAVPKKPLSPWASERKALQLAISAFTDKLPQRDRAIFGARQSRGRRV